MTFSDIGFYCGNSVGESLVVIVVAFPMLKRGSHSKEMHERNSSCISMIVVKILMMVLFKLL